MIPAQLKEIWEREAEELYPKVDNVHNLDGLKVAFLLGCEAEYYRNIEWSTGVKPDKSEADDQK